MKLKEDVRTFVKEYFNTIYLPERGNILTLLSDIGIIEVPASRDIKKKVK